LLQFAIERSAAVPIYTGMVKSRTATEISMQAEVILKFLADSRDYFGS
jgi:hypothetical protein